MTSAFIIVAQLAVAEKMGAGRFLGCVVVTSILLDQDSLVGCQTNPTSTQLVLCAILMIGVMLVAIF